MPIISAGIFLYRLKSDDPEVLLFHPGGPYWAYKDKGAWSIAKGEVAENKTAPAGAIRELEEESGIIIAGELSELQPVKLETIKSCMPGHSNRILIPRI
jgi:predicted NUDIX family NTP pyrophosphohydrolase